MGVKTKTIRAGRGHDFTRPLEWSAYKHKLLKKYLHVWCYKLGGFHRELAFVDTCAGAGRYQDGSEGSPLIAARYNDDKGMFTRGTGITVYAFETWKEVYPQLVASLAEFAARTPPRAVVSNNSFFDDPQPVLAATRRVPTLFFIDPYGTEETTADRIGHIVRDANRASTELLVRIDPTLLARYAGWVRRQSQTSDSVKGAAAFRLLLERLNVDTEEIASEAATVDGPQSDKWDLLSQYLQLYTDRFRYVQLVPVRASYDFAPKYMMVHATDSAHGAAHLNDVVSKLEDELFTTTYEKKDARTGQGSFFGPPPRPARYSVSHLDERALASIAASAGGTKFIDLRAELAMHFGPHFREKDHKAAVKRLIDADRVQAVGSDTALKPATVLRIKTQQPN